MVTFSLNCFPKLSSQQPNINAFSSKRLSRKKTGTNSLFLCTDQSSKNFSSGLHLSAKNRNNSSIVEKDSVSSANGQLSSKLHDGLGIVNYFSGKKLFITGATGFLAKVLVENKDAAMERLTNEIINTELSKCLREKHGLSFERFILSKLVPVVGNICETNIGIQEDVANSIAREVDIIIHSAASTEFDARFDISVDVNTGGTARLVSFAKTCENLKLYVHISTAYVCRQAEGKIMEESFGKGHFIRSNADIFDASHEQIQDLDIEAELRLASELEQSSKENEKGRELGMRRDMVVNSTLAAIAKHGRKGITPDDENSNDYHVYQIASSAANPLSLQDLFDMAYQHFILNPFFDKKGNPIQITEFKFFASLEDMISQMEQSTNSTTGDEKMSQRQELLTKKLKEHVKYLVNIYRPYSLFRGRFDNSKTEELLKGMSEEERKEFGFDVRSINWNDNIKRVHLPGIRKHVLKERGIQSII